MLLNISGTKDAPTVVMIHGACMTWRMFRESVAILEKNFRVINVAVPGHDDETGEEFTSVPDIAGRIEKALAAEGYTEIDMLYGLSMGGGIAIKMLADNAIKFRRAVIDAGITPYELPYIVTRLILIRDFLSAEWGKHSKKALSLAFPPEVYTEEGIDEMYSAMRRMTATTIWRVFDSTDNYPMPDVFPILGTRIEYWYGSREKRDRKLDIEYVKKHIAGVMFREIPDMMHGQYALMEPEKFAADITERMP